MPVQRSQLLRDAAEFFHQSVQLRFLVRRTLYLVRKGERFAHPEVDDCRAVGGLVDDGDVRVLARDRVRIFEGRGRALDVDRPATQHRELTLVGQGEEV